MQKINQDGIFIMKLRFLSFFIAAAIILSCILSGAGCRRDNEVQVPSTRSNLLLDIIRALDRKDYKDASAKLERYKALDPSNEFIPQMERILHTNAYILQANEKIARNDINGASNCIDEAVRKLGGIPSLVQTRDQLRILTEVNSLLNLLNTPVSSPIMKASAEKLARYCEASPEMAFIKQYADQKIQDSEVLAKLEKDRLYTGLYFDAYDALQEGDPAKFQTISTILSIQDPGGVPWKKIVQNGYFQISRDVLSGKSTEH